MRGKTFYCLQECRHLDRSFSFILPKVLQQTQKFLRPMFSTYLDVSDSETPSTDVSLRRC